MLENLTGSELVLLGSFLSIEIAKDLGSDELALIAALYTVIGDQLALILATRSSSQ